MAHISIFLFSKPSVSQHIQLSARQRTWKAACPYRWTTMPMMPRCLDYLALHDFRGLPTLGIQWHSNRWQFLLSCQKSGSCGKIISVSFRLGREKEIAGRKSLGSLDVTAGIGVSPPVRFGGPEEQRSVTSSGSLGPVSNVLLIPRLPSAQYEVSSSLGYTSTRGETYRSTAGIHQCCLTFVLPSPFSFCSGRDVRENGVTEGLQCSRKIHSGECWVPSAHPSWSLHPPESTHQSFHPIQDATEANLQPPALDAHLPHRWGDTDLLTFIRPNFVYFIVPGMLLGLSILSITIKIQTPSHITFQLLLTQFFRPFQVSPSPQILCCGNFMLNQNCSK